MNLSLFFRTEVTRNLILTVPPDLEGDFLSLVVTREQETRFCPTHRPRTPPTTASSRPRGGGTPRRTKGTRTLRRNTTTDGHPDLRYHYSSHLSTQCGSSARRSDGRSYGRWGRGATQRPRRSSRTTDMDRRRCTQSET